MCFIDQLDSITFPTLLQTANVASDGSVKSERFAESSARNFAGRDEWNATRTNARPTAAASSAVAVSERWIAGRTTAALSNRTDGTTELHRVATQPAESNARLPKESELWNLFWNFRWIGWIAKSNSRLARLRPHIDIEANSARASLELIATDKDSTSDHHAIGEVNASAKANLTNCRSTASAINSSNHSHIRATSSALVSDVVAAEASQLTHASANASDHRNQLR